MSKQKKELINFFLVYSCSNVLWRKYLTLAKCQRDIDMGDQVYWKLLKDKCLFNMHIISSYQET